MKSSSWLFGLLVALALVLPAWADDLARGVEINVTAQGAVSASSVFDGNFLPENAIDGNTATNWFSDGDSDGDTEVFTWTRLVPGDVRITRIQVDPETFMGGGDFGFATAQLRMFDAAGVLRFAGPARPQSGFRVDLNEIFPGTPANRVELVLAGHQDPICGGFSELRIFAEQDSLPPPAHTIVAPSGSASGDRFGDAVAADGSLYAVGRPGANGGRGEVVIYRVEGGVLVEDATIAIPGGRSVAGFGAAVALDDGQLLVGAPGLSSAKGSTLQAALFERTQAGWTMKEEFASESSGDSFGAAVALAGSTMVVGAPGDSVSGGQNSGAVYVFSFDGNTTVASEKLKPVGEPAGARFGAAVGIDRGRLGVGAPGGVVGRATTGSVHLYDAVAGNLSGIDRVGRMNGSGSTEGGTFGASVAVAGNTMIVGAPGEGDGAGAAYVFDAGAFNEARRVTLPAGAAGDAFGTSVAASATGFAVGAPGFGDTGGAFEYASDGTFAAAILGEAGQSGVGGAVGLSQDGFLAGAPVSTNEEGAALVSRDPEVVYANGFE
ncbi:MAG: hypothetical protein AAGE01_22800 [Pseudomonadota bacterium]